MNRECHRTSLYGGSAPATPGFNALGPEWLFQRAAVAAPAIPAAESALGAHPCVALSSAQVLPEWITSTPPVNAFAANGTNPLNFVSHSRGSLQVARRLFSAEQHGNLLSVFHKTVQPVDSSQIDVLVVRPENVNSHHRVGPELAE